ncbi:MAG: SAM-dependent methyltransferase, partial [Ginsengibacter sp.]
MYSAFQLARKYFHYYITAKNGKGHGIHSPFVFDFITNVLNDHKKYECYSRVESLRKRMLQDKSLIEVEDFGAGSGIIKNRNRSVKNIAASSLKNRKFSQLLFRIVNYYQPRHVIELGTSLGITTSYLA